MADEQNRYILHGGDGRAYHVTDEEIRAWKAVPPAVKLQLLEEAVKRRWESLSPEQKERHHRGEL